MTSEPLTSRILGLAARVVEESSKERPADAMLRRTLKVERGLARQESREVARAVFSYFRWFRWLDLAKPVTSGLKHALELDRAYGERPQTFSDAKLIERAVPAWILDRMPVSAEWVRSLQTPPLLWLRARSGRAREVMECLGSCRFAAEIAPGIQNDSAIHYSGPDDLFRTPAFHKGLFELQDLSSQVVGWVCDPKPGETWWDACAGEGGKTLHLSDLMGNKGLIWASDRAAWRLDVLKKRAARAGCFNYRSVLWEGNERLPTKTKFNGVLVDAPCSGVGTWQRNPHGRWTLEPGDVEELATLQERLLSHASQAVKAGGCLVYSVCTLTIAECDEVCAAFAASHSEFEPEPSPAFGAAGKGARLWLKPPSFPANGMFIARWRKRE